MTVCEAEARIAARGNVRCALYRVMPRKRSGSAYETLLVSSQCNPLLLSLRAAGFVKLFYDPANFREATLAF